jgi:excisionase family DNA binding protein
VMNLADRLRELAQRLPPGASLTLTKDGLLELATVDGAPSDQPGPQADFTVAELATRFHRSASTVRGWCEHGRFEDAYKLNGRDWRIPLSALDAFLAEQRGDGPLVAHLGAWRAVRRVGVLRQPRTRNKAPG